MLPGMVDGHGSQLLQRRQLYAGPMSKLRMLMICRMAKPEEVLIVEDENGNIVRETLKDNDVLVQYKVISSTCSRRFVSHNSNGINLRLTYQCLIIQIMRETLIYLAHLDHEDTEKQVFESESTALLFCWKDKSHYIVVSSFFLISYRFYCM